MTAEQPLPRHISDQASRWIAARDAGIMTPDDDEALKAWIDADPRHAQAFAEVGRLWEQLGDDPFREALRERPCAPVVPLAARKQQSRRIWIPTALAASLALFAVGAIQDWPTRWRADASTAVGERKQVALADGSHVLLDTDSAIEIGYLSDRRVIRLLKGEAAFTVAADPRRPFTVEAGTGTTTALGTRFIVSRRGQGVEVTVTEHSVRIGSFAAPARFTDVTEGERLRYGPAGLSAPERTDVRIASAWTRGLLLFVDRPLGEVVAELNRYHSGYIGVIGADLARHRVSGGVRIDDPVGAVDSLERMLGIHSARLTDRLIFLHG
ncbi:FecR family protein [Sphingobium chlorophenolicum]|uniref:Anti-FecI sigma factor, FecR n=1 Tax=Sphingobium chlorophenolicum TaxID=46429 RepID=A0A081RA90_SPHCR|nr:FecR domain-containing protein [Sphingobium chlorophenolicum]KEQ52113.1 Anti-FecI sigma factor, FecR [Sphingobium chlorophenolicum]